SSAVRSRACKRVEAAIGGKKRRVHVEGREAVVYRCRDKSKQVEHDKIRRELSVEKRRSVPAERIVVSPLPPQERNAARLADPLEAALPIADRGEGMTAWFGSGEDVVESSERAAAARPEHPDPHAGVSGRPRYTVYSCSGG